MNNLLGAVQSAGIDGSYVPENEIWVAHDGRSEYQDYLMLARDLDKMEMPPGYNGQIPEPATALLAALDALFWTRRRRQA